MDMRKFTALMAAGLVFGASGMAMAASATGTMTTTATLTGSCTVNNATMTFPSVVTRIGGSDAPADTGTTLAVACTTGTTPPTIFSDTARTLVNGADSFASN